MAGTKAGGAKAAVTNIKRHGEDFYARIGSKGGKLGHTGGYARVVFCRCPIVPGIHKLSQCAGTKGGRKSRRS